MRGKLAQGRTMAGRDLVKTEGKIDIEMSQERGDAGDNDQLGVPPQTEAGKKRDLTQNFDHIYSHVATDHDRRRSKDSDQYNTLFDSQIELPDLNDLIDSPLVPEVPKDFTLTRSSSEGMFGSDGNTVQIEEDSIHSFDTEGDSRSLLLNDTLTEVSDMFASATTCPGSDNEIYASPDDDHIIDPVYEEIPFLRNRNRDQPVARCSAASNEDTFLGEDNPVDCQLATKPREPATTPDACAPADSVRVPECDVIYQKVSTPSSRGTSSSVESKPRDDTMAFFKRSFAKVRLDLLFRKKKNNKFVEVVEKVIEARRSGCIDEEGNFVQALDEQLKKHAKETAKSKKKPKKGEGESGEKRQEAEVKPQEHGMGVSNPNYRESYPLPEEDDGSEGYASASEIETVDSSNSGSSGPERSPRLSGILSNRSSQHESSEDSGDVEGDGKRISRRTSSRRVRFSDEVQEFEHIHLLGKEDQSIVLSSSDDESVNDDDVCVLSLTSKISLFENMSKKKDTTKQHPKLTRTSGHRHSDPGPTRDSMIPDASEFAENTDAKGNKLGSITKARVQVFEKLSNVRPGERKPPKPKPRTSLLEIRMNQTKMKIMFFEQLKSGQILPLTEEDEE